MRSEDLAKKVFEKLSAGRKLTSEDNAAIALFLFQDSQATCKKARELSRRNEARLPTKRLPVVRDWDSVKR